MRRIAAFLSAILCAGLLGAAGQPVPRGRAVYGADQDAALDKISAYLNSIHSLKSTFVQLGPQGQLDQGEFYLEKPGRLRFSYEPPNPTLIVATGGRVYVKNARLNTVDHYDIDDTPLGLLLNSDVDLKNNRAVTGIDIQSDALIVHARTSNNRQQGNITLVFSPPPDIELRQWTVRDNQGGTTTVALHGLATGVALDDSLFVKPVKSPQ